MPRMIRDGLLVKPLRVALFTDSFNEANGVATLSRQFVEFARRHAIPFCCVHGGAKTAETRNGSVLIWELKRSLASFPMDTELYCDPLLSRYRNLVVKQIGAFQPDLIHITGPGDVGILGFWISHVLRIPMVASWHTNLHQYLARRLHKFLSFAPVSVQNGMSAAMERQSLRALTSFYRLAHFLVAPNAETVEMLTARARRPSYLMSHGVDTENFSPQHRTRQGERFCIGYVGRLTPEKNVRELAGIEHSLRAAGQNNFEFHVVGEGSEREWLQTNLRNAKLSGILRGDSLAKAFANMDALVFPSQTDTFGLVILEAMASGVPVVTRPEPGRRAGVEHGATGFLGNDLAAGLLELMRNESQRRRMAREARRVASTKCWCPVFQELYRTYELALTHEDVRRRMTPKKSDSGFKYPPAHVTSSVSRLRLRE